MTADAGNGLVQVNVDGLVVTLGPGGSCGGQSAIITRGIFSPIGGGVTYFASPACLSMDGMDRFWPGPFACTVQKLHVHLDGAPGVRESVTVTLRKNGVNQDLEVVLNDADQDGSDTANSFSCVAGDRTSVSVTGSEFSLADSACVSLAIAGA